MSKLQPILFLLFSAFAFPVKGQYDFSVSETEGCIPMKVKYSLIAPTTDSIAGIIWDFDNGSIGSDLDPDSVTYILPRTYTPSLGIAFNGGYSTLITKSDFIKAHRVVPANFNYYDSVSYKVYVFEHAEPLDTGVSYTFNWDIEGFAPRTGPRQLVIFADTGIYTATLTVTDEFGCTSQSTHDIIVLEEISVQNVFSPNDDGNCDHFIITTNGAFPVIVRIFTRAGILVYEAEGTTVTWDGVTASGQKLKPGIYFYAIEALHGDPNKRYSKAGVLYLYK